jgi:hypothetical protein
MARNAGLHASRKLGITNWRPMAINAGHNAIFNLGSSTWFFRPVLIQMEYLYSCQPYPGNHYLEREARKPVLQAASPNSDGMLVFMPAIPWQSLPGT